jgi:hypothetical protein
MFASLISLKSNAVQLCQSAATNLAGSMRHVNNLGLYLEPPPRCSGIGGSETITGKEPQKSSAH